MLTENFHRRVVRGLAGMLGLLALAVPGLHRAMLAAGLLEQAARAQLPSGTVTVSRARVPGTSSYPPARRNVLLIIGDDIGVDKIQPYIALHNSNTRTDDDIDVMIAGVDMTPLTPTITMLANSGVMFVNAWACPTCSPTRASIYTGTHPFRHNVYRPEDSELFSGDDDPLTADDPTTIAEVLGTSLYASGLFGKWHLGDESDHGPVDHGWERHEGSLGGGLSSYCSWTKCTTVAPGRSGLDCVVLTDDDANYATTVNYEDASSWIQAQTGRWMATVAFNAAHTVDGGTLVGQEPPVGCGSTLSAAPTEDEVYRATIECMDAKIALLLAEIPATQLANTTIIFMGDNGTPAARSDTFRPDGHAKDSIYEGGVNVPFIVADGSRYLINTGQNVSATGGIGRVVNSGRISAALVHAVDLYATIADIAGADGSCGVDAKSLIPLLENTAASVRETCFVEYESEEAGVRKLVRAVRGPVYKLIVEEGEWDELYNLSNDRWEQTNLLTDGSISDLELHVVEDLKSRMNAILAEPDCTP